MDATERFRKRAEEHAEARRRRLDKARAAAPARGKEPFDGEALAALWMPIGCTEPAYRAQWLEGVEEQYYVDHRDVMTLAAFAQLLELNDLYDGGDMHID